MDRAEKKILIVLTVFFAFCFLENGCGSVYAAQEFTDTIEQDFPVRSIGRFNIINYHGSVSVRAWSQDRIRVRAVRRVFADDNESARKLLLAMGIKNYQDGANTELVAEYGRGFDLSERLKNKQHAIFGMDITVLAPPMLELHVNTREGMAKIEAWKSSLEVRTSSGGIYIDGVSGERVSSTCKDCRMDIGNIRSSTLKCSSVGGGIRLSSVTGSNVYVESASGDLRVTHIKAKQFYVSKGGRISGYDVDGEIEFYSRAGAVEFVSVAGFITGATETGSISLGMREWRFSDHALVESVQGDVTVTFPPDFSGIIDAWSGKGEVEVGFPLSKIESSDVNRTKEDKLVVGKVNNGSKWVKIRSKSGIVRILSGK
ncbi:MAG: DUF4097 family beta strand repeat-containing protein [Bdellovibrionota bacterium]